MIFDRTEEQQVRLFRDLVTTNPFLETRTELEKSLLGGQHKGHYAVWHSVKGELSVNRNLDTVNGLCDELVKKGVARWNPLDAQVDSDYMESWDRLALYWLFARYSKEMCRNVYLVQGAEAATALLYDSYEADYNYAILLPDRPIPPFITAADSFALFHQVHRAFNYIFDFIAGGTSAAAAVRGAIWQSIFTCDFSMYCRQLLRKMNEITTLITGESGTGKELAARAIAYSQFIPFDVKKRCFVENYCDCFYPIQLSAIPASLVESELFGHERGAFTDAIRQHRGQFEFCGNCGSILLDEISEVSLEMQVKLLRLLQSRVFRRIGGSDPIAFKGRVIAATNSDLSKAVANGSFRQDLLFRLCSDTLYTEPLRALIDGRQEELENFVMIVSKRLLGEENAREFAAKSLDWIIANLGIDYSWPGNVRELEQCLRNLMIRGSYKPMLKPVSWGISENNSFWEECTWNADELLTRYVRGVNKRMKSIIATARATGLNPRTVKKYLGTNSK